MSNTTLILSLFEDSCFVLIVVSVACRICHSLYIDRARAHIACIQREGASMRKGHTGKRERPALHHGAVGIVSLLLLCLTLGNWFFVLHPLGNKRLPETKGNGVPDWLPALQQQPQRSYPAVQWLGRQQHKSTSQSMAYSSSRRDDVMPAEFQTHISNNLRRESVVRDYRRFGEKQRPPTRHGSWRSSRGGTSSRGRGSNSRAAAKNHAWGKGMTVLIFTVDSLTDVVAKSKTGGPAGEIIVRESLTTALTEAGVQVRPVVPILFAAFCRLLYEEVDGCDIASIIFTFVFIGPS